MSKMLMPAGPVLPDRPDLPEIQVAKGQEQYLTLPSVVLPDGAVVTRWDLSDAQREAIARGEQVYVTVWAGHALTGRPQIGFPPVAVHAGPPEWIEPQAPDPAGDVIHLPAPQMRLDPDFQMPTLIKLDILPAPGTVLQEVGTTLFYIARDAEFKDSWPPFSSPGLLPSITLRADMFPAGCTIHVKAQFVPPEGVSRAASAFSNAVSYTFNEGDEADPAADQAVTQIDDDAPVN